MIRPKTPSSPSVPRRRDNTTASSQRYTASSARTGRHVKRPERPPDLPIGVFDSGVGGLTVLRQLHRLLPTEDLVYLGDTARVPYGTKSPRTVIRFACEDTAFLLRQGVKAVVVACNTCSAWAIPMLQSQFNVPVFGVIEPGVRAALAATRRGRIGVIGTTATIRSQAYTRSLQATAPTVRVFARACPLLVPLVEEGWRSTALLNLVFETYLRPLLRRRIDTLILGCTHYPLLKPALRRFVGRDVRLVDSAESCAKHVRDTLVAQGALADARSHGHVRLFVTDEPEDFGARARRFLGMPVRHVEQIELTSRESL